jgi:5-methylcytosine-specific restriction protein A
MQDYQMEQDKNLSDYETFEAELRNATKDDFIRHIQHFPNRKWADSYLNLLRHILSVTGLANNDPRLVMSIPKGTWTLPVSINYRYILAAPGAGRHGLVGIIFGPEYENLFELHATINAEWRFRPLRGEGLDTPFFLTLENMEYALTNREIRIGWEQAMLTELPRAHSSPFKKFHQPIVYRAAMESFYRQKLLDAAF